MLGLRFLENNIKHVAELLKQRQERVVSHCEAHVSGDEADMDLGCFNVAYGDDVVYPSHFVHPAESVSKQKSILCLKLLKMLLP